MSEEPTPATDLPICRPLFRFDGHDTRLTLEVLRADFPRRAFPTVRCSQTRAESSKDCPRGAESRIRGLAFHRPGFSAQR